MKHVFLRFSSLAFFSLLRSAKVSMMTPKMRLRMMTLIRMKNRRSYTTRKKKLESCTTREASGMDKGVEDSVRVNEGCTGARGPSGMDNGVEDSIRVNEGCMGEGRSMNSRRVGGRQTKDGGDRGQ